MVILKLKKLGKRTIKTGFAVSLTLIISNFLELESPFFASIAVIIAMQSSIYESFRSGKNRMYATIIGAIIALVFSLLFPEDPILIGLGVIIIIYICNSLGLTASLQLASMVFLSIILNYREGSRLSYALNRTLDTFIGLIIGTLVNYFVFPHKIEPKVQRTFEQMYYELKELLKLIVWDKEIDIHAVKIDIQKMEKEYNLLKLDIKYTNEKLDFEMDFETVFEMFEETYNHISILSTVSGDHTVDKENKVALESLFKETIPLREEKHIKSERDIIFNYHLRKTLSSLASLEYILDLN